MIYNESKQAKNTYCNICETAMMILNATYKCIATTTLNSITGLVGDILTFYIT